MSTISKERLLKIQTWRETYGPGSNVVLPADEAEELARIALASLKAEAVCVIDQSNLDYLKSGSDADVWPASRTEMGDVLLYRTSPPAPVSVPEDLSEKSFEYIANKFQVSLSEAQWILVGWSAYRAAMLQGAENYKPRCTVQAAPALVSLPKIAESRCSNPQVIPDCSCRTCRPVTMTDMRFVVCPDCGNKRCPHANDHRNACTGSNEPGQEGSAYPAAPQQE